ncbi:MAG: hypothetical protein IJY93_05215 [Clostridia bacterium]|nr:hypothetical protein [Clostridia bacterium]
MNILEDLWFGNISPWERPFKKDGAYSELLTLVIQHQDDLKSRLNDEEKAIFEKYADCTTEMHDMTEREAFVKGFTIGARIIIEVLTNKYDE